VQHKDLDQAYKRNFTVENYTADIHLAFSKERNKLPVISTRVEESLPCMKPTEVSKPPTKVQDILDNESLKAGCTLSQSN